MPEPSLLVVPDVFVDSNFNERFVVLVSHSPVNCSLDPAVAYLQPDLALRNKIWIVTMLGSLPCVSYEIIIDHRYHVVVVTSCNMTFYNRMTT